VRVELQHFQAELLEKWVHIPHGGKFAFLQSALPRKLLDVFESVFALDEGKVSLDIQTSVGNDASKLVLMHTVSLTFRGERLAKTSVESLRHFFTVD